MTRISNIPISFALLNSRYINVSGDTMTGALNTLNVIPTLDSNSNLGSTTIAWANLYVDTISSITGNALALTPVAGQSLTVNLSTTGDFIVNTDDLVVDTSTGNVGIGKVDPGAPLHVIGGLLAGGDGVETQLQGDLLLSRAGFHAYIYGNHASNEIRIRTGGTGKLVFQGDTGSGAVEVGQSANIVNFQTYGNSYLATNTGGVGIGVTSSTAVLHLKAGTATANTAPLKFNTGTLLTTAEAGAIEFLTDAYYGTITTGAARRTFAFLESPVFTGTVTIPTPFTIGAVSLTATATELNILDGATLTTTELNYVDGVTSAIQTQLDGKASTDHGASNHTDRTRRIWFNPSDFEVIGGTPTLVAFGTGSTTDQAKAWAFDDTTREILGTTVMLPSDWAGGAITFIIHWAADTDTDILHACRWTATWASIADGESIALAREQIFQVNVAVPSATAKILDQASLGSSATGLTAGDTIRLTVMRLADQAGDTMTGDALLLGVEIQYTADM